MPTVQKPPEEVLQLHKHMGMVVMKHLLKYQSQLKLRTRKWNHPQNAAQPDWRGDWAIKWQSR